MDLFERLFQKVVQNERLLKATPGTVFLKDHIKYMQIFADSMLQGQGSLQVVPSRDFVGVYNSHLFLPEKIHFFKEQAGNLNLYKNLILQSLASFNLKLVGRSGGNPLEQRLDYLKMQAQINQALDENFSGYRNFQEKLINEMIENGLSGGVSIFTNKRISVEDNLFHHWKSLILSRNNVANSDETLRNKSVKNKKIPEFVFVTVPCLSKPDGRLLNQAMGPGSRQRKSQEITTQKEKSYSSVVQSVDLEKEKQNPIMHSFEKLETADEYDGGRRFDSGDDELNDHANALEELNLSRVTRGGEAAQSVYNSELVIDNEYSYDNSASEHENKVFLYPEWNYKKNVYIKDHCQLFVNSTQIDKSSSDFNKSGFEFKEKLIKENFFQIKKLQSELQNLLTEPIWIKKLKEGNEIDIDEYVREFGSIMSRKSVDARWYMEQRKRFSDIEIMILFDQSLSSDSWVQNRRILDVELEAVGLTGLLFDQIFENVTVAGVWSSTRTNCAFQIYKQSNEAWDNFFRHTQFIKSQGYTRLGPALRHATALLKQSQCRKKLILLLTDGKPTDVDGYEGKAGITDMAQAVREMQSENIFHYALLVDNKERSHFSKIFKNYLLLQNPKDLSRELFAVLLRLLSL